MDTKELKDRLEKLERDVAFLKQENERIRRWMSLAIETRRRKEDDFINRLIEYSQAERIVADYFNISKQQLASPDRSHKIATARGFLCVFCHKGLNIPLTYIGERLKKHHSSIIHGRDRILDLLSVKDQETIRIFRELLSSFLDEGLLIDTYPEMLKLIPNESTVS